MTILIMYNGADGLGGIETLMAQFAAYFLAKGHRTICLLRDARPIRSLFLDGIEVVSEGRCLSRHLNPLRLKAMMKRRGLLEVDSVIAMDRVTAIVAVLMCGLTKSRRSRCVATNWVPNYLDGMFKRPFHPMSLLQRWTLQRFYCSSTLLFMNSEYDAQGRKMFGSSWSTTLFPVSVDVDRFRMIERSPVRGRVVSIGRLQPMKEYNLYMIDIVASLLKRGFDVNWDVYGYGEYEGVMRHRIQEMKLSESVRLRGPAAREDVPHVLSTAMIFVGMGRAVMEAAAAGVPNIVALAYDSTGMTHGSLRRLPFGIVGERLEGLPLKPVEEEIVRILGLSDAEYEIESADEFRSTARYDDQVVMKVLEDAFVGGPILCCGWPFKFSCWVYSVTREVAAMIGIRQTGKVS